MFSRVETNKPTRSRKRQKRSHDLENQGESSTRSTRQTTANPAMSASAPSMEQALPINVDGEHCVHKKELGALEVDLESMRQLITCKVCQRFLTEPYALACGHTYCYICLDTWLVSQKKNTCPECRATVRQQPTPSLIIREMVQLFSVKQKLLPAGETIEELDANAKVAADKVAKDKADSRAGGLFKGIYAGLHGRYREPMYDHEDNVHRCPVCFHEIEDGQCTGCGEPIAGADEMGHWSDEDELDLDLDAVDAVDAENIFGNNPRSMAQRVRRDVMRNLRQGRRNLDAMQRAHARDLDLDESDGYDSYDSGDEDGDLEGFVVSDDDGGPSRSSDGSSSESTVHSDRRVARTANANRPIVLDSDSDSDESVAVLELETVQAMQRRMVMPRRPLPSSAARRSVRAQSGTEISDATSHSQLSEDETDLSTQHSDDDEPPIARRSQRQKSRSHISAHSSNTRGQPINLDPYSDDETVTTNYGHDSPDDRSSLPTAHDDDNDDDEHDQFDDDDEGDDTHEDGDDSDRPSLLWMESDGAIVD